MIIFCANGSRRNLALRHAVQERRPRGEFPREGGRFAAVDVRDSRALARGVGEAASAKAETAEMREPPRIMRNAETRGVNAEMNGSSTITSSGLSAR